MEAHMKITEEMIRALQNKIDISYEEAERYLQKSKGDVDIAVMLYKEKQDSFSGKINSGLGGFLKYRIIITRSGRTLVDLPIALMLLLFLINSNWERFFIVGILFVIALVAECEFKIEKREDSDAPYNGFSKTEPFSKESTENSSKTSQTVYSTKPMTEKESTNSQLLNAPEIVVGSNPISNQVSPQKSKQDITPEESVDINNSQGYNNSNKDGGKDSDKDDYYEIVIEE